MTGQQALRMHQLRKVCEMKRKYSVSSEENPANRDVSEDPDVESELETEPMTTPPTPQEYCISIDKSYARWSVQQQAVLELMQWGEL
jgi:hypothetical protein